MKIFTLDEKYSVVCNTKDTRNGFKHVATIHKNGLSVYETKECYLNRTWERFEYETVLVKAIENFFGEPELTKFLNIIKELN
jgi:hypothetical protein